MKKRTNLSLYPIEVSSTNNTNETFTFYYCDKSTYKSIGLPFHDAVKSILNRKLPPSNEIYKMIIENNVQILYFNEKLFLKYIENQIYLSDLIEATSCKGVFRNKINYETSKNEVIDSDNLWILKNDTYILIDEERYLLVEAPDENFYEV